MISKSEFMNILKHLKTDLKKTFAANFVLDKFKESEIKDNKTAFNLNKYYFNYIDQISKNLIDECRKTLNDDDDESKEIYSTMHKLLDTNNDELRMLMRSFESNETSNRQIKQRLLWIHTVSIINDAIKFRKLSYKEYQSYGMNNELRNTLNTNQWFRGQTNYEWELTPSFFRNIDKNIIDIDYNFLVKKYDGYGLTNKYNNIFGMKTSIYSRFAYYQHSVAYSPFLDFTEKEIVAKSFAISNKSNISDYNLNDSAFYKIEVYDDEVIKDEYQADKIIQDYNVLLINDKIYASSLLKHQLWLDFISSQSAGKIYLIDIKTNDRMKYQKGVFTLFDNFIIVGNKLLLPSHIVDRFVKVRITLKDKQDIRNLLANSKNEAYQYIYMMNPYEYFAS
ncbi:FRG domain-containing protein [Peloplasma aerotolerans]|uniref:FRG domain-containing protein n=1 Tax=Peloplasma aerotolerans TaxID=3044389 RepID=A0AAW6U330_9MOLU|nr:FRG domain-containing protein [Mariniplasma sp. M4Ah]MDI6452361.1 FRG domain-containing protein [Mariniplasma sp. M4Ah]